jgi:hypothetical protein
MAKKKNTKKSEKGVFLGSLDRLGGKKLIQHGAEASSRGKESRKHRVRRPLTKDDFFHQSDALNDTCDGPTFWRCLKIQLRFAQSRDG